MRIDPQSLRYRPPEPEELWLIVDSWAKGWRNSPWAGTVRNDRFFDVHRDTIVGLIARGAKALAAVADGVNGERVLGWVCYEEKPPADTVVHYCYVKDPFRRNGLGRELVHRVTRLSQETGGRIFYTHRTRDWDFVKPVKAIHAPEIARRATL